MSDPPFDFELFIQGAMTPEDKKSGTQLPSTGEALPLMRDRDQRMDTMVGDRPRIVQYASLIVPFGGKMKPMTTIRLPMVIAVTVWLTFLSGSMAFSTCQAEPSSPSPRFVKPITTDPKTWLNDQVNAGKDVYLSANYLFQVMKLRSQKTLMDYEAQTLLPALVEVLEGMKGMGVKGDALVCVEVARKLLTPGTKVDPEVADEVAERVSGFLNDPQNTPRGHYASSDELKRYSRGMQFLTKATFDVAVDKNWFAQRMYMLFPFEGSVQLVEALSKPENAAVLKGLEQIHAFYDRLVGSSDLPSFHDLLTDRVALNTQAVLEYARGKGLPRINRDMGVGIQCLGERFSPHQYVIESISQKLLANDPSVSRKKAFDALRFRNIFLGIGAGESRVPGLVAAQLDASSPNISYYELCLAAVEALPDSEESLYSINAAASSVAALAEQTIIVTKQTTLVVKSIGPTGQKREQVVKIFVQPDIEEFLNCVRDAENNLLAACGEESVDEPYRYLAESARNGKPLFSDSPEGATVLNFATPLAMDPTVTADVFFFVGRTDKAFLQWAIGPFEVEYQLPNGAKATGMEMVFFEGWHDSLRKGAGKPLTNEQWRALFLKGQFKNLYTFVLGKR